MPEKTCTRCKRSQPLSEFGKNKNSKDGLWLYCKTCDRVRNEASRRERGVKQRKVFGSDRDITEKRCYKCKTTKSVTEFNRDSSKSDGYTSYCKACLGIMRDNMTEQQKYLGYLSDRKYVTKHRSELNLKNRLRYRANREACLAYHARRRNGEKREAILRQKRQYHLNNREQIRIKDQERGKTTHGRMISSAASRRYAQTEHGREIKKILANNRRVAAGTFTPTEWHDCLAKHDYKCAHCGSKDRIEIDHVRPIHLGGTNDITNLQPLCRSCNAKKGGRYVG